MNFPLCMATSRMPCMRLDTFGGAFVAIFTRVSALSGAGLGKWADPTRVDFMIAFLLWRSKQLSLRASQ